MSDEQNESGVTNGSGAGGEEQETMFTCKKCPGVYFKENEKAAHRAQHRKDRRSARNSSKPGPRSSKRKAGRRREASPDDTGTLFSVRQDTPPINDSPPADDVSQRTRKRKAVELHEKQTKKQRGRPRTNGG